MEAILLPQIPECCNNSHVSWHPAMQHILLCQYPKVHILIPTLGWAMCALMEYMCLME